MMKPIIIGMKKMTLEDLINISRRSAKVQLAEESEQRIKKARKLIDLWRYHRLRGAERRRHIS
jgi:histidine ammonia-lyase